MKPPRIHQLMKMIYPYDSFTPLSVWTKNNCQSGMRWWSLPLSRSHVTLDWQVCDTPSSLLPPGVRRGEWWRGSLMGPYSSIRMSNVLHVRNISTVANNPHVVTMFNPQIELKERHTIMRWKKAPPPPPELIKKTNLNVWMSSFAVHLAGVCSPVLIQMIIGRDTHSFKTPPKMCAFFCEIIFEWKFESGRYSVEGFQKDRVNKALQKVPGHYIDPLDGSVWLTHYHSRVSNTLFSISATDPWPDI